MLLEPTIKKFLDIGHFCIPIAVVHKNGIIIKSNEAFKSFFPKLTPLKKLNDLVGSAKSTLIWNLNEGQSFSEIIDVITKENNYMSLKFSGFPILGESEHFHLILEDVTFQKEQYDLALQAKRIARVGSWSVDLVKNKVTWSRVTREIHEVPENFIPDLEGGIDFYKEGIHRDRIIEVISECIKSGKSFDVELVIITARGNEKWVRAMGEADQLNGKTVSFSGIFQDIDKMKRQQLAYDIMNERMHMAINSAHIGIWDFDIVNNVLIWDDNMYNLYDVHKDEFKGVFEAWEAAVHPDDIEKANLEVQNAIKGLSELNTEFRIIKRDGSISFIHAEAKVINDEKGVPVRMIGANNDVTRLKKKDEQLSHLLEVTKKQNQRLMNFTNIVSHNLRSNSSNISMLSGMLDTMLPLHNQRTFIEMIKTSSAILDQTIVDLNEVVKIQATDTSALKPVSILKVLNHVMDGINGILLEAGAQIDIDIDKGLSVQGIEAYLQSIFHNLFTNSIKYRDPTRTPKISITNKYDTDKVIIFFQDNGIGIDLNKNGNKIFGMYKTFHSNTDAKGIGLFITKNHVEAMNGDISVSSSLGEGTTFHLVFENNIS